MRIKTLAAASALSLSLFFSGVATAAPILKVTPTLAPNGFGSPSWDQWVANSIYAQAHGLTSYGDPNSPTFYQAFMGTLGAAQGIVTGFPSWLGQADPGTVFGPAYANELGNRMHFGLYVDGNGSQFAINDLSLEATSSDALDALGFSIGSGSYTYSLDWQGILKGADGMLGTADDVYITSGPATQLVDGLVGRGTGNSLDAYCTGCSIAQQQQAILDAASYWTQPTTFTGVYSLPGGATGEGTFNINPLVAGVPEPATWAMMILGFGLIGGAVRRRKVSVRFA